MLEVYIDKEFLLELAQRTDMDDEVVHDFIHYFLKKVRGVRLVVNTTLEELKVLSETKLFFAWLLEINPSAHLRVNWTNELEHLSQAPAISKLFLLSNAFPVDAYEKRFGCLYLNNQNLKAKWAAVRIVREEDFLSINSTPGQYYWQNLPAITHPFTQVLLFDNYVLSDKNNQELEHNLYPLLNYILGQCCSSWTTKEVVIVSGEILERDKASSEYERLKRVQHLVQQHLPANTRVEVIRYDPVRISTCALQKEHDRFLFTNYLYFEAGSGFSIYSKNGAARTHLKIAIRSVFKQPCSYGSL